MSDRIFACAYRNDDLLLVSGFEGESQCSEHLAAREEAGCRIERLKSEWIEKREYNNWVTNSIDEYKFDSSRSGDAGALEPSGFDGGDQILALPAGEGAGTLAPVDPRGDAAPA